MRRVTPVCCLFSYPDLHHISWILGYMHVGCFSMRRCPRAVYKRSRRPLRSNLSRTIAVLCSIQGCVLLVIYYTVKFIVEACAAQESVFFGAVFQQPLT